MGESGKKLDRMVMFLGAYHHSLDDRSRVSLPKKMRAVIDGRSVVITRGFEACILGYQREEWEREAVRQLEIPIDDARGREMRRYLFSGAEIVELDRVGRILLPTALKTYAGITQSVTIIGAGDHFEIWDEQSWKTYLDNLKYPRR